MSKRRRNPRRNGPSPAAVTTQAPPPAPAALRRRAWRRLSWVAAGLTLVAAAILVGCYAKRQTEPEPRAPSQDVAEEFRRLRNAGDPKADDLLGPAPAVPDEAVTQAEADRLNAEFMLRGAYKVDQVLAVDRQAADDPPRFVLSLKGDDKQPLLKILNPENPRGYDTANTSLTNPDVAVEVRDGKLYALGYRWHRDPNAKRMSPEEGKQFLEALTGHKSQPRK